VLGADVVVAQLQCFAEAQLKNLLGTGSKRNVTGGLLLALADDVLNLLAHRIERNLQGFQRFGGNAFTLVNESQEDVLGADVVVVGRLSPSGAIRALARPTPHGLL
jgi:hypothetical protein